MPADAGPNMELQQVLWLWFSLGWLANFPITSAAELLDGNRAFVAENDVFKRILSVYHSLCEFESFDFVYIADQLAVLGVLKSPPLLFTRSPRPGGMNLYAAFGKLLLNLVAGCFVVLAHFRFDEIACQLIQLSWTTRFREIMGKSCTFHLLNDSSDTWIAH